VQKFLNSKTTALLNIFYKGGCSNRLITFRAETVDIIFVAVVCESNPIHHFFRSGVVNQFIQMPRIWPVVLWPLFTFTPVACPLPLIFFFVLVAVLILIHTPVIPHMVAQANG
jgi:hypothetical protein